MDMLNWSFVNLSAVVLEWTIPKQNLKTENEHWKRGKFLENIDKIQP